MNGRLWLAISKTETATPVANRPNAIAEVRGLSLCIIAIATSSPTASRSRHDHLTQLICAKLTMMR